MKFASHLIGIILIFGLVITGSFTSAFYLFFILAWYAGTLMYIVSQSQIDQRKKTLKQIGIYALAYTIVLVGINLVLTSMYARLSTQMEGSGSQIAASGQIVPMFSPVPIWGAIIIGALMFLSALLVHWLNTSFQKDTKSYREHVILVVLYMFMFPIIYHVVWFYRVKKALAKDGEQIPSLWWFLLPVVGPIYLFVKFSQSLEKVTKVSFIAWFLILLLLEDLHIVVCQAILNHNMQPEALSAS